MLADIQFRLEMPFHKRSMTQVEEAKREIIRKLSNPRERLAICYHEAAHGLQFQRFGASPIYFGPAVGHIKETNEFVCVFGSVGVLTQAYQSLSAEQLASVAVAGVAAETVLIGDADPEAASLDFENFIQSGKGKPSDLVLLWKQAEQTAVEELKTNLNRQKEIVHEGGRVEVTLFGFPERAKR
jgi:hypothetical protein